MSAGNGDHRKRCFLGMPGYGEITAGAARAFYHASSGRFVVRREQALAVRRLYREGSLLAANFNKLWCAALNDARRGGAVDYFAMQHSDVQAEDLWLDTLIDEMEAKNLDVLGVAIPIKDTLGLTSTALARPDGDNWRPHARLTLTEVYRLPETFTSEDVGYPLLINTGLWVCRFAESWARKTFFTINDRIVIGPNGDYEAQVEPEDWFFSRLCHELNLRVGCTRKVAVAHRGPMNFENTRPWGDWTYDEQAVSASPVAAGSWFPHDAAGWLTEEEGTELAEAARGKLVLEIGSYCGRSTVCLAQHARGVYAVDTFDGRGTAMPGETLKTFRENMRRFGVADRVYPVKGVAAEMVPNLPAAFDLVFIDGAHDVESVRTDINLALAVLRPGGLLAFHDYDNGKDPGVKIAVDELLGAGAELLRRAGSVAIVRPDAADVLEPVGS